MKPHDVDHIKKLFWYVLVLIVFIDIMLAVYLSQVRFFNADEFQILYESSSLNRDKALYKDEIGGHFPFVNIFFSLVLRIFGHSTAAVFAARFIMISMLCISLFFVYKIGEQVISKKTGLISVAFTISYLVFINRGIEVRNDAFNMFFNVLAVYCILCYIDSDKIKYWIFSGFFLGLSLASTQKAIIWNVGIMTGSFLFILRGANMKEFTRKIFLYLASYLFPVIICMFILTYYYNETFYSILQVTIFDMFPYLLPESISQSATPFPYPKFEYYISIILRNNLLLCILAFIAVFFYTFRWTKNNIKIQIILLWSVSGLLFYFYMKRPFDQSLLPSIPALSLLSAFFLMHFSGKNLYEILLIKIIIIVVISFSTYLIYQSVKRQKKMDSQIQNISFCLSNLSQGDEVLSFSQQQIFFDSVFKEFRDECGRIFFRINVDCFVHKMIKTQCKVVIYDYRTTLLNEKIQEKIKNNYQYAGTGNILIPGFLLKPNDKIEKEIWIEGCYHSPSSKLIVDGKKNDSNIVYLKQRKYFLENPTTQPINLLYLFHCSE